MDAQANFDRRDALMRFLRRICGVKLGLWMPFAPNWLTVYGTVGTLASFGLFFVAPVAGIIFGTFWALFDLLDGFVARGLGRDLEEYKGLGADMNFPGKTHLGKVLDPFADKVKHAPMYAVMVMLGYLPLIPVLIMFLPEAIGTLKRWPFDLFPWLKTSEEAALLGKVKNWVQYAPTLACLLVHEGWVQGSWLVSADARLMLLALAGTFAWASLLAPPLLAHMQKRTP